MPPRKDAEAPDDVRDLPRAELAPPAEPEFQRHGDECSLCWPAERVVMTFTALRDGHDGPGAELAVDYRGAEIHWGKLSLASTSARESVVKKLGQLAPVPAWRPMLERACRLTARALRQGEPLVTLTGKVASPTRGLVPAMLYEGEPTLLFADGDTGKSLVALTLAAAVQSGAALPCGLTPARPAVVAYLDWETSQDTLEGRLALIAAGLGIAPPAILYRRMGGPLVNAARDLAAEFSRRQVGLVVIDSMMFAVSAGEGAAFHEPITAFYNALRLFGPAATLVLNHVTGADARTNAPARPFGGAFAFNGPRLIWEARRDKEIEDATAIAFTCKKANNLARKPAPFGLVFEPGAGDITVRPFNLDDAAPETVVGVSLFHRLKISLARGPRTVEALAEELQATEGGIRKTFSRLQTKGVFVALPDTKPQQWALGSSR